MYRPSARALSLVNNGRGGVQGEYRREKVEKVKLGWDSQLGLSRTRTKSIECGLTSSSSDDEEEDSPPVVNPRAQLFGTTPQPSCSSSSSGWQTILRQRNETLKERKDRIERAKFERGLTKQQKEVAVVGTTKKNKKNILAAATTTTIPSMFSRSVDGPKQVSRGDVVPGDSLDSFIADDDEVEWVSKTLSESEEELELESSEPDENDAVKMGGYSSHKPKVSCKSNSTIVEEEEKEQRLVHSSQHHPMQGHGEGLHQKAKQQDKRKKRRLVRCKHDIPLIPCLPNEQIEVVNSVSRKVKNNTKEKGRPDDQGGNGRGKENVDIVVDGGINDDDFGDEERDDPGEHARNALLKCMNLSQRLAKAVGTWQEGNAILNNVISLTNIPSGNNTSTPNVFTNAHVSTACPKLSLRSFQLVGVNWLSLMYDEGVNGVLADEMGLGKTVQTIAFLGLLRQRRQNAEEYSSIDKKELDADAAANNMAPHIIVVPSSVLSNWEKEFQKFCPALRVMVYHGSAANRADIKARGWGYYDTVDVVLTTYTMWERESSVDDRRFILGKHYDYLVLDEGHSIKNARGSRFLRLKRVRCNHRLLLTGTPVQNNVGELLSLLSFLMPDIFDRAVVETAQEGGVGSLLDWGTTKSEIQVQEKNLSQRNVEIVRSMLAPFVLRRLKSSVLDQLAEKEVDVQLLQLQPFQRNLYNGIIENHIKQRTGNVRAYEARNVFVELRKAANHPLLLHNQLNHAVPEMTSVLLASQHFGKSASKQQVEAELSSSADYDLHRICLDYPSLQKYVLMESDLFVSAKFERLRSLLPLLVKEGRRILLFSQWTRILDLLDALLEVIGLRSLRLDGSTPVSERQTLIDRFREEDIPVFLLSTRAGGLGINLTSADTVILHDVDFNPEVDAQAVDRCHRIGQEKSVRVIKLIASGSVDEDILTMADRKRALSSAVLGTKESEQEKYEDLSICQILQQAVKAFESPSDIYTAAAVPVETPVPMPEHSY